LILITTSCGTTGLNNDPPDNSATDKFLGTWNVSDQPARLNYIVKIKQSVTASDQVILENFADLGKNAVGLVVNNTIILDSQNIGSGFTTEGTGDFVNENKLQFEFFLDDGIDKELRKAIFTR
jgi:hypothetical protein